MRFRKKEKVIPQFIGSYEIIKYVGEVGYELNLSPEFVMIHPVFHVLIHKKCIGHLSLLAPLESIGVKDKEASPKTKEQECSASKGSSEKPIG